jgi:hypothetical protein
MGVPGKLVRAARTARQSFPARGKSCPVQRQSLPGEGQKKKRACARFVKVLLFADLSGRAT